MAKFKIFFLFFTTLLASYGQEIKKYVIENSNPIYGIETTSDDYSDLEIIGNAIGNSKIVMLGEQDHGDAPTFLAKTRLIKYLHERKGFNVVAFESDFFGINYYWDFVKKEKLNSDTFFLKNIYPIWTYCHTCTYLFHEYIPSTLKTRNPLQIAGIDNQMYSDNLFLFLDSSLRKMNLPIINTTEYSTYFPKNMSYSKNSSDSIYNNINNLFIKIKSQLLENLSSDNFLVMIVENFIQLNIEFKNLGKNYWKSLNTRDEQMANNLKWLCDFKYPNEKIIVWAHNYHISKNAGHYNEESMNKSISMGSVFTKDSSIMNKTYIIGFTSYQGTFGRLTNKEIYRVGKPKKNSFENWIDKEYNYAFIDFKKYNSSNSNSFESFNMSGAVKGGQYHENYKAQWNHIFDGVFYIKNMYPCEIKKVGGN